MTRQDCLNWMAKHGFPTPPRSACRFCPFHGDAEWKQLKENQPEEFARAVEFEAKLQLAASKQEVLKGIPFLHTDCKPLSEIDFNANAHHGQLSLFGNECEGMCGV